jgi:hypothetical protein
LLDDPKPEAAADDPARRTATLLGVAGLAPFAVLSLWLAGIPADHVWRGTTILLLAGYAAVVLSFLGGTRWGLAVAGHGDDLRRDIAVSVAPPLLGWVALMLPPHYAFVLLAVAFAAQGAWDALAGQNGLLPHWFVRLRMQLTVVVVLAMVIAFAATATG